MADPYTGSTGSSTSSTDSSGWLSSIEGAIPATVGLIQAGQATRAGQNLTNQISGAAAPQLNLGNATLTQLEGGAPVGGPMGTYISGATSAANEQLGVAQQYGTGQLTPAQQLMIDQAGKGQNAQLLASLGGKGGEGVNSSAALVGGQQIQNNQAILAQQLVAQNQQIAQNAIQAATSAYNGILTTTLNQSGLGTEAIANAVKQQLANNSAMQGKVQELMKEVATALGNLGGKQQPTTDTSAAGNQAQNTIDFSLGQTTPGLSDLQNQEWGGVNIDMSGATVADNTSQYDPSQGGV